MLPELKRLIHRCYLSHSPIFGSGIAIERWAIKVSVNFVLFAVCAIENTTGKQTSMEENMNAKYLYGQQYPALWSESV